MAKIRLWAFTAFSEVIITTSTLPAQQIPIVSLSHAQAILHSRPLAVQGLPIVAFRARPCQYSCLDSIVDIEQAYDSTTKITVREWWVGPGTRRYGWLEECRNDLRNLDRALDIYACPEPRPQAIIHGLWVEIDGPLPRRVLAGLLDHLDRVSTPTQGS